MDVSRVPGADARMVSRPLAGATTPFSPPTRSLMVATHKSVSMSGMPDGYSSVDAATMMEDAPSIAAFATDLKSLLPTISTGIGRLGSLPRAMDLAAPRVVPRIDGFVFPWAVSIVLPKEELMGSMEASFAHAGVRDVHVDAGSWEIKASVTSQFGHALIGMTAYTSRDTVGGFMVDLTLLRGSRDLFRPVYRRVLDYFAAVVDSGSASSVAAVNAAVAGAADARPSFFGAPIDPLADIPTTLDQTLPKDAPVRDSRDLFAAFVSSLLQPYADVNTPAAESVSGLVSSLENRAALGTAAEKGYKAFKDYAAAPASFPGFKVDTSLLLVDTVLKRAINRPAGASTELGCIECRTMCAFALANLTRDANCAQLLLDMEAPVGIVAALEGFVPTYETAALGRELLRSLHNLLARGGASAAARVRTYISPSVMGYLTSAATELPPSDKAVPLCAGIVELMNKA